jgi:DNA-binding NarL/FixJ family response regulator
MKILVIDDHPLIREGLANVLRGLDGDLTVLEAEAADEGMEIVRRESDLTMVLLDLVLPGVQGLSLLQEVRTERPDVPVCVLSGTDSPQTVREAIDAGAMGFISKRSSTAVLVSALRLVVSGAVYIPPQALGMDDARRAPDQAGAAESPAAPSIKGSLTEFGLTGRQADVLALLIQGKPNKLISRELNLAEGTVKTHVAAIFRALNVSTRTQAVFAVSKLGIQFPFGPSAPRPLPELRAGPAR